MWFLLIAGLGGLALYEYAKTKSCASCSQPGAGPATCGICYAPIGGSDGTGGDAVSSCCGITNDRSTWPAGDEVWDICQAIAIAEGANVEGADPDTYINPGDLSKGDEHGQAIVGYVNLPDGETLIQFETKTGGWQALYTKIDNIRKGISLTYRPSWTWNQIAAKYAGDSADWVANVTRELGVSPTDTFASYFP
jgi:hypothetical protein